MSSFPTGRIVAAIVATLLMFASAYLIYQRGGVLAWLGAVLGAGLLLKALLRPAPTDLPVALTLSTMWMISWAAIFYYVISTWETGEVIELTIELPEGNHVARTWIIEAPEALILYYDAPATAGAALVSGAPIKVKRGNEPFLFSQYSAAEVKDMQESEINAVLALMAKKYGDLNDAADIYYGFLGRSRDRIGIVVKFPNATIPE